MTHDILRSMDGDPQAETEESEGDDERTGHILVTIVEGESVRTHRLPSRGRLLIGRGSDCAIALADPEASRHHAALDVGLDLKLKDLGSANGTRVGATRLDKNQEVSLQPGQVVEIGQATLLFQRHRSLPRRRIWSHGYFSARLEEECDRARATDRSFTVLTVDFGEEPAREILQRTLLEPTTAAEVVARHSPGRYELLLLDDGEAIAARVIAAAAGIDARIERSSFPRDGTDADALLARDHPPVIIESEVMLELSRLLTRLARGQIGVLLLGETGAGKEVFAELLHQRSRRADRPFVRFNCAALGGSLAESELFGHEKGAFTGAERAKPGLIESADGGTVFLDEVGEMSLDVQAKLLRVIEQKQVRRLGAVEQRKVDVRFVSATNRDLAKAVKDGLFRQDLYYRLAGATVTIPPLRERKKDIEELSRAFLEKISADLGLDSVPRLTPEARSMILDYSWPGNVRELKNVLERALLVFDGEMIDADDLSLERMSAEFIDTGDEVELSAEEREDRARIQKALADCGGNQTRAAQLLGIARRTLTKRLNRYALPRPLKG